MTASPSAIDATAPGSSTDDAVIDTNEDEVHDPDDEVRIGSVSSARFNILSTMVGGGCLSLPLAFQQSGNALVGPLMLLGTGVVTEFCFKNLVASAVLVNPPHATKPGKDTFESIASEAFGQSAYVVSMGLVVLMCFFGTVGYSVLLRDMMEPLNDAIVPAIVPNSLSSEWLRKNFTMFGIVVLVTPFCTLRRLTALKDCGAASMLSLLILGSCIVIRSVQCNLGILDPKGTDDGSNSTALDAEWMLFDDDEPWYTHLRLFPESWHDLLNALPLYISCFVCHYNILPVHNELQDPTPARVKWWLRSTTWFAVGLYMVMGFAGSAYSHCTPTGTVQGNILLDFDENDPLLMVGRMCLAVTITLAFPMLVIPGRDIVIRSLILPRLGGAPADGPAGSEEGNELREPLLEGSALEEGRPFSAESNDNDDNNNNTGGAERGEHDPATTEPTSADAGLHENQTNEDESGGISSVSALVLLCISVVIFWSAAALASLVSSIDVVWDLLGSSLSILMSYLIPAGTYLVITNQTGATPENNEEEEGGAPLPTSSKYRMSRFFCWILLGVSVPLMVVSTANAVYNTFFQK